MSTLEITLMYIVTAISVSTSVYTLLNMPQQQDIGSKTQKRGTDAPRKVAYGRSIIDSTNVYNNVLNDNSAWIVKVFSLGVGPITAIRQVYVNDLPILEHENTISPDVTSLVSPNNPNVTYTYTNSSFRFKRDNNDFVHQFTRNQDIQMQFRYGKNAEVASDLAIEFSDNEWTVDHRGDRVPHVVMSLYRSTNTDTPILSSVFTLTALVEGVPVHDPRFHAAGVKEYIHSNSSVPAINVNIGRNPALCLLDFLTDTYYGMSVDYSYINIQSFMDAANWTDTNNLHVDGSVDTGQKFGDCLSQIMSSFQGVLVLENGLITCKYEDIVLNPYSTTFDENNTISFKDIKSASHSSYYNIVQTKYKNTLMLEKGDVYQIPEDLNYIPQGATKSRIQIDGFKKVKTLDLPMTLGNSDGAYPKGGYGISWLINGVQKYFHLAYGNDSIGSGFSQSPVGKTFVGTYIDTTLADAATAISYNWTNINNSQGYLNKQGIAGIDVSNAQVSYLHIAFADSISGSGFNQIPTSKTYVGTYIDFNLYDSLDTTKYTWGSLYNNFEINGIMDGSVKFFTNRLYVKALHQKGVSISVDLQQYPVKLYDVIKISNKSIGWVDKLFRITTINTSVNENSFNIGDLICVEYNDNMYTGSLDGLTGRNIKRTYQHLNPVTNLVFNLHNFITDGYGTLTWTNPNTIGNLSYKIQYKLSSEVAWKDTATSEIEQAVINNLKPTHYDFRVKATRLRYFDSDYTEILNVLVSPTVLFPNITNIASDYSGLDFIYSWDDMAQVAVLNTQDPTDPNSNGTSGKVIDYFSHYEVKVFHNNIYKQSFITSDPKFVYLYSNNKTNVLSRAVNIEVYIVAKDGTKSTAPAIISGTNQQISAPANIKVNVLLGLANISWTPRTDLDFAGTEIHISTNSTYVPSATTLVDNLQSESTYQYTYPVGDIVDRYIILGHYDNFSETGINYSVPKLISTTAGFPVSDAKNLSISSSSQIFSYDSGGVLQSASQINFTANRQNINTNVVWTTTPNVASGSTDNFVLTSTQFGTQQSVKVTATSGTFVDEITVVRLQNGINGISYTGTTEYYKLTNSVTAPTVASGGWLTTPSTPISTNKYLWNYNKNSKSDGTSTNSSVSLITQYVKDGKGISSITELYQLGVSSTTAPTGTWSTSFSGAGAISSALPYMWNKTTIIYTDTTTNTIITMIAAKGINSITAILSNESHTIPTDSAGNNGNYIGSATTVRLYEGATELIYDGIGTSNSTWKITVTATNITAGTLVDQGNYVLINNSSAMTADVATISIVISGVRANGTPFSITKQQSLSKSKTGLSAAPAIRGSKHFYLDVSPLYNLSATAFATNADIAITNAGEAKVNRDVVTLTNPTQKYSETKYWDTVPTTPVWATVTEVVDGSLIVNGTVGANQINTTDLFSTDITASGVITGGTIQTRSVVIPTIPTARVILKDVSTSIASPITVYDNTNAPLLKINSKGKLDFFGNLQDGSITQGMLAPSLLALLTQSGATVTGGSTTGGSASTGAVSVSSGTYNTTLTIANAATTPVSLAFSLYDSGNNTGGVVYTSPTWHISITQTDSANTTTTVFDSATTIYGAAWSEPAGGGFTDHLLDLSYTNTIATPSVAVAGSTTYNIIVTRTSAASSSVSPILHFSATQAVISGGTYTLPTASTTVSGGIKVGNNLSIDVNGKLSSTDTNTVYTHPATHPWSILTGVPVYATRWPSLAEIGALGSSATAANSILLNGIDSTQFLRSDVADTMVGKLSFAGEFQLVIDNTANAGVNVIRQDIGMAYLGTQKNCGISFYRGGAATGGWLEFYTNNGTSHMKLDAIGNLTNTGNITPTGAFLTNPNGTGNTLSISGIPNASATQASVAVTNGNLHLDAVSSSSIYLNYYHGTLGVKFCAGNGTVVAVMGPDGDLWKGAADNTGYKYWNSGNDGSGSGLDADLLDGIDSTAFGQLSSTQTWTGTNTFSNVNIQGSIPVKSTQDVMGSGHVLYDMTDMIENNSNIAELNASLTAGKFAVMPIGSPASRGISTTTAANYYSAYIPVKLGEKITVEIYAMQTGSTARAYMGIERYDKDKKPIAVNNGTYYSALTDTLLTTAWTKYSFTSIMLTTHTPYLGSDGGAVCYIRLRLLCNYATTGQAYYTGMRILRQVQAAGGIDLNPANTTVTNTTKIINLNADLLDGIDSTQFLRSDTTDYQNNTIYQRGYLVNETAYRDRGVYGNYDPAKTNHIWSMGVAYRNAADGSTFGNLYGLAYKHVNNTTGGTMAGGHQMVWCQNGTGTSAMGTNIWTSGSVSAGNMITGTKFNATSGGLSFDRTTNNSAIWFANENDTNHVLYNTYAGVNVLARTGAGTGTDGIRWNTWTGLEIRTGSGGVNLALSVTATDVRVDKILHVGASNTGYFYQDVANRTAYAGGDFYIQSSVTNSYNYATNNYHGSTSGDAQLFRGNTLTGNSWSLTGAGAFNTASVTATGLVSASDCVATSDRRVKYNIKPIENAVDKILKLTGNTFNRTDMTDRKHAGIIAQDVEQVLPEAIFKTPDEKLGEKLQVSNTAMIGLLVQAVKEQATEIAELKAIIKKDLK